MIVWGTWELKCFALESKLSLRSQQELPECPAASAFAYLDASLGTKPWLENVGAVPKSENQDIEPEVVH